MWTYTSIVEDSLNCYIELLDWTAHLYICGKLVRARSRTTHQAATSQKQFSNPRLHKLMHELRIRAGVTGRFGGSKAGGIEQCNIRKYFRQRYFVDGTKYVAGHQCDRSPSLGNIPPCNARIDGTGYTCSFNRGARNVTGDGVGVWRSLTQPQRFYFFFLFTCVISCAPKSALGPMRQYQAMVSIARSP